MKTITNYLKEIEAPKELIDYSKDKSIKEFVEESNNPLWIVYLCTKVEINLIPAFNFLISEFIRNYENAPEYLKKFTDPRYRDVNTVNQYISLTSLKERESSSKELVEMYKYTGFILITLKFILQKESSELIIDNMIKISSIIPINLVENLNKMIGYQLIVKLENKLK